MDDEPMINWHTYHPVYGRGPECQACGCGYYSDVHDDPFACDGDPAPPQSRVWYCTACVYQERLRPAVVAFTRPTDVDCDGVATFYCAEHLEGSAGPLPFPPEAFLINVALHASRDGDDPEFTMLDVLLGGLESVA